VRSLWPTGGLWRHGDFLKLWSAESISQVGSRVSALALPLVAVIVLKASAFEVALLGVIEFLPFILVSLPAGVWVDRMRRRPILVAADMGRFLLLLTVPFAYWADVLTIEQLYVVGFLVGICTVFFDVSYQSYLPSLVARDQLVEGNSKLEISRSGAQLGGPGLAGVLIDVLTAPVAVLMDAISFLLSAVFLFRIRKEEVVERPARADGTRPSMKSELAEGMRYVFGHPYIRAISASTAIFNFFGNVAFSIFLVYAVRVLDLSPSVIGLVFSLGNVGYLVGALTANRIATRIGIGPTIIAGAVTGIATFGYPLAPVDNPVPFLVAASVVTSWGVVVYNITQVSMRQAITPERMQGRMNSVIRFIVWGVIPLGSLTGGALASAFDLRLALWVSAIGMSCAFVPLVLSPVRSLMETPEPLEEQPGPIPTDAAALAPSPATPDG
jgi:MFS family permease